uniref:Beta-hexosaminidase n=1 Tax=Panagrellus redivivus TaxID=6233 RepID=A0A7E4ZXK7_PANRE
MWLRNAVVLICILGSASAWYYGRPDPGAASQGGVWPLPWTYTYENTTHVIDPASFEFVAFPKNCEIIDKAIARYKKLSFPLFKASTTRVNPTLRSVTVTVSQGCSTDYPQEGMDESYSISAKSNQVVATLTANTVWGALRGLETFSQLFFKDANGNWFLRPSVISDKPRFPHRGIMLDTARHFVSVTLLKRQIDLLAQNKFNVLHWHLVDDESFPYTSAKFPDMTKGAYTSKHVYTVAQIKDVIEFARLRGIRVIPEFDTPGHTGSWGFGNPSLLADCFYSNGSPLKYAGLIDPTLNSTWTFLEDFFAEATSLFKDNYFHFGGDEVEYLMTECWGRNVGVLQRMQDEGIGDTFTLLKKYFADLVKVVQKHSQKTKFIFWEEVLDYNVAPEGSVAHVWKEFNSPADMGKTLSDITAKGHRAILSSCWYLNYIKYGADWGYVDEKQTRARGMYYECDPQAFDGTDEQKALILGGEVALWAEFVDGSNITPRLWPRASAVGERLWSDPKQTVSPDVAWPRLHEFRCRLLNRGYEVEPPNNPDYCPDEWDPQYYPDLET